jgi:hypothetical protein
MSVLCMWVFYLILQLWPPELVSHDISDHLISVFVKAFAENVREQHPEFMDPLLFIRDLMSSVRRD